MAPKLVIIADDLTGALDTAAPFAMRGMKTLTLRKIQDFKDSIDKGWEVVSLCTATRESGAPEAARTIAEIAYHLRGFKGIIFKKIDSRLQGNIAVELAELADLCPGQALVCPAIPRLGRFVENGTVCGAGVETPIPVRGQLGNVEGGVVDARNDADLDAAIAGVATDKLLVGAAGLAEALARSLVPDAEVPPALLPKPPVLLTIGSRDPVTMQQVERLEQANLPVQKFAAPNGVWPAVSSNQNELVLLQLTEGTTPIESALATRNFAEGVAALVQRTTPQTLFACGGESANAILETLGIGRLQVAGEVLPGVPYAEAINGVPGLAIITKSGGFGGPQTLVDLCRKLRNKA